jgi:hypothetical protein
MISNLEERPYAEVIAMLESLAEKNDLLLSTNLIDFADDLWAIATEGDNKQIEIDNLKAELKYFYGGGK